MIYRLVRAKHSLAVGKELSDGGQGRVFTVLAHPNWVFKEYKSDALAAEPTLKARIQAMVHAPPAGTQDKHGHIVLTWPVDLVTADNRFVGFVMPRVEINQAHELHEVVNPTGLAGGIAWDAKIAIAENLVRGVRMVHARNVVIGDFNERNILVWRDGRVTLLDCDSMQIRDGAGNYFFCRVGRVEFTAPELLRKNWNTTVRHQSSDLFALALHIHQLLLNGEHPFRGLWNGSGEKPEASKLAEQGVWAYGGGHKLQPRRNAPDISLVSPEIKAFFQRAFVDGARHPSRRPSTDEWLTELDALRRGIRTCRQDHGHKYRKGLSKCPWCALEKKRAAARKPPPRPSPVVAPTAVPPITVPPPAPPAPAPMSVSSRVSNHRTWVLVLALLATGLFPYFLGRWLQPEVDIANLAYSGVPLAELLGWFQVALPPYLVGAGAILAAAALWSMRPAKLRRPIATMSLRRSVLGVFLVVLGLLLATIVGPQRSQTLLASAPDVYQNSPVADAYGPTLCSGILTWTSTSPGPVQTWRAEENKSGDCVRVQNYVGWAPGWEYRVGVDTELQDWVM